MRIAMNYGRKGLNLNLPDDWDIKVISKKTMPVVPELRAIWDAMRPAYQAVLGGASTPEEAARDMQGLALRKIKEMNE